MCCELNEREIPKSISSFFPYDSIENRRILSTNIIHTEGNISHVIGTALELKNDRLIFQTLEGSF